MFNNLSFELLALPGLQYRVEAILLLTLLHFGQALPTIMILYLSAEISIGIYVWVVASEKLTGVPSLMIVRFNCL
jgi:hypothetical protein